MGRKNLIAVALLCLATLHLSAQNGSGTFEFIENKGQWNKEIKFKGEFATGAFFLTARGFSVNMYHPDDLDRAHKHYHHGHGDNGISRPPRDKRTAANATQNPSDPGTGNGNNNTQDPNPMIVRGHTYLVEFEGANPNPQIIPEKAVSNNTSYFIGNDPSRWANNVGTYTALTYKNVYEGIDVRYYADYGNLKYDIIVHPGADLSKLRMQYSGAEKLSTRNGELLIKTSVGTVRERYPYSYQFDMNTGRQEVECKFVVANSNTVKFDVKNYNRNSTLVIDPTVIFVSFTGSFANEYGFTATPAPDGSLYSGSIVFGEGFRTTPGAYKQNFQGGVTGRGTDVGIFKFTANGQRAWATYIGGSDSEYPHSLICDAAGNLVIIGRTYSGSSFPIDATTSGILGGGGNADLFITKLSVNGNALIGSIVIGGSGADCVNYEERQRSNGSGPTAASTMRFYGDDSRSEVVLDADGAIYVAAQTQSLSPTGGFHVTSGAFQTTPGGGRQDGVVLKIDRDCRNLVWSSFLGGSGDDGAFVLAVHPTTRDIYVAGTTNSGDLPGSNTGVHQANPAGGMDGFILQISNDGTTPIKHTYLGTGSFDAIYGIRFDRNQYPYVMGVTEGGNWPVINAAYSQAGSAQFIVKLRRDLSGIEYSTVFGNGRRQPNMSPVAFLVDRCENVYISGWGGWIAPGSNPYNTGGVLGMPLSADAMKTTTDDRDLYFFVLKKDAAELLYGSYFGQMGGEGEHVDGGTSRYDELGVIYQALCANCFRGSQYPINQPFPVTTNAWSQTNGAGDAGCNLAAVKIRFNFAGVISAPKAYSEGRPDTSGCAPFAVTFRDTIANAKTYEWDYDGDGVTDEILPNPTAAFTYNNIGTYRVRMIAVDSASCNIRDTSYLTILVRNDKANIDFTFTKLGPCESTEFLLDNQSTVAPNAQPFLPTSFTWDFADGSAKVTTDDRDITHKFFGPGTYPVKLILANDDRYCNSPDTVVKNVRIAANVRAQFVTPPMGCQPYDAVFTNTSIAGTNFEWDFGDGSPISTDENPTHTYPNLGTYTVKLTAYDNSTCNKVHDTTFTLTVNPKPVAVVGPQPDQTTDINKPAVFTNNSNGIRHKWIFGDGEERITNNLDTVHHQYNATGTYNVTLITFNQYECTDTATTIVHAWVNPLLDVPNAFTPGRGGRNSTVMVQGFGINTMTWKIYNRNGQKVFETNNRLGSWDGTFRGQLQPMDVYVYTLEVQFTDGRRVTKTGDITLIR